MKNKKAVRKLGKVEAILSDIVDRHSTLGQNAGDLMADTRSSVGRLREVLTASRTPGKVKKSDGKPEKAPSPPEVSKKLAPARKKGNRESET